MNIVTKHEAKILGLKTYFTGQPCIRGHVVERTVSSGNCKQCSSDSSKEYHKNNRKQILEAKKLHYYENREEAITRTKKWNEENKEQYYCNLRSWRQNNPEKYRVYAQHQRDINPEYVKRQKKYAKQWRAKNRDRVNAYVAKRKAQKLNATVVWANQQKINDKYKEAVELTKATGIQYVVDHMVPLISKIVCGLHCEDNLQIITMIENSQKCNKLIESFGG